jgi:transcriptional regulator with XRE-family HTH domain
MVQGRRPNVRRQRAVLRLRQQGWTLQAIASRFGVSYQAIACMLRGGKRGAVTCTFCGTTIATVEGSSAVRGAACVDCLAARPDLPFSQVLLSMRMAAELSQMKLAKLTGLTWWTISNLERGVHEPQSRTRERLLEGLRLALRKCP